MPGGAAGILYLIGAIAFLSPACAQKAAYRRNADKRRAQRRVRYRQRKEQE